MYTYKDLVREFIPLLKQVGFSKKGNSFYIPSDKNYGIINFQKSTESNHELVKFTINFGVYSDVLGQFQYGYSEAVNQSLRGVIGNQE